MKKIQKLVEGTVQEFQESWQLKANRPHGKPAGKRSGRCLSRGGRGVPKCLLPGSGNGYETKQTHTAPLPDLSVLGIRERDPITPLPPAGSPRSGIRERDLTAPRCGIAPFPESVNAIVSHPGSPTCRTLVRLAFHPSGNRLICIRRCVFSASQARSRALLQSRMGGPCLRTPNSGLARKPRGRARTWTVTASRPYPRCSAGRGAASRMVRSRNGTNGPYELWKEGLRPHLSVPVRILSFHVANPDRSLQGDAAWQALAHRPSAEDAQGGREVQGSRCRLRVETAARNPDIIPRAAYTPREHSAFRMLRNSSVSSRKNLPADSRLFW